MSESNNNSVKFRNKYKHEIHNYNNKYAQKKENRSLQWKFLAPIAAVLCYINGLTGDFVHDDVFAIQNNPDVQGRTSLLDLFKNDFWGKPMSHSASHKSYRPLTVLTFRLNYLLFGAEPVYFHLVNVLLHAGVTFLLTGVCHEHFKLSKKCSAMVGVLFAVHPIHTEAVTGIVGRADLLAALLFLISFISYNRSLDTSRNGEFPGIKSPALFLCSVMTAAVAMLCKETGITVLGVSLCFDCLIHCHTGILRAFQGRKLSAESTPLILRCIIVVSLTIFLLACRLWIMDGTLPQFLVHDNPASFSPSLTTRALSYSFIWVYNIWLLLAPANLCYDWQIGSIPLVESFHDVRNLATLTFYITLFYAVYRLFLHLKSKSDQPSALLVSLIFMVLPFLPATNLFIRVGFVLAERVLYIPSIGFCLCVGVGCHQMSTRWRHHHSVVMAMFSLLVLMHAGKTWKQNNVWLTRESLFRSGIQALPHNAKVHYNYANFLKDSSRHQEAIHHYRASLRLLPDYASCHNNLGTLLENRTEAEYHFREALRILPSHPGAHVNLGNVVFKRGERVLGMKLLQRAVDLESNNIEALTSLGSALMETGDHTHAEKFFKMAIAIKPDYTEVYTYYGALLHRMGRHKESAKYYQKAFSIDSRHSGALAHAAYEYKEMGDLQKAEDLLKKSLSVKKEPDVMEQLAMIYFHSGRTQESLSLYKEIQKLAPNATKALIRYSNVLGHLELFDQALLILQNVLVRSPDNVEALRTIAGIYFEQGKYSLSVEYCGTALRLAEEAGDRDMLMKLYCEQANNFKALDMFEQAAVNYKAALEIDSKQVHAHINLGAIYHSTGDIEKAQEHYQAVLKYDPGNKLVQDNMKKLNRLIIQKKHGLA